MAIAFGPVEVRWYTLAYAAGLLYAFRTLRRAARAGRFPMTDGEVATYLLLSALAMLAGARLGYAMLYGFGDLYLAGGNSFHGALLGIVLSTYATYRDKKAHGLRFFALTDALAAAAPLGIALGRLGNFVNQELWGRVTTVPWGMVFPAAGPEPRHPSQLYQALGEGALTLIIVQYIYRNYPDRPGAASIAFLTSYGILRCAAECFRQPDPQIGLIWAGLTLGQLLSAAMLLLGLALLTHRRLTLTTDKGTPRAAASRRS